MTVYLVMKVVDWSGGVEVDSVWSTRHAADQRCAVIKDVQGGSYVEPFDVDTRKVADA